MLNEDLTDQTILEKAIAKAKENGYPKEFTVDPVLGIMWSNDEGGHVVPATEQIIYRHDFAKCFFGGDIVCISCGGNEPCWCDHHDMCRPEEDQNTWVPAWQFHLREMVLEPEPLKYLAQFLEEE